MATELAKAYVQIVPSARGLKEGISGIFDNEMPAAGKKAGGILGSNIVGVVKGAIATAGIGKALSESIKAGADLQQSLGGIETLFKGSADTVIKNAERAYQTAGMSANSYMEMVTGFSASLLQGLAGDTGKAAEIADMSMKDMSDNANKMGTDMELIKNAYSGFAKQNYTMLDNLKLGYGGTKTEMERLLADAQNLSGIEYNIDNLADVYSAIHVIQEELDITGTTAKEAATTISGSAASMKAAFKDLLANLSLGNDIGPSLQALTETVMVYLDNLIPAAWNVLQGLPEVLEMALTVAVRNLYFVSHNMDSIVQNGIELVIAIGQSIISALPYLAEAGFKIIAALGNVLLTTDWTQIVTDTISSLRDSMDIAAGEILGTDGNLIQSVVNAITTSLPDMLNSGVEIIINIADGILQSYPIFLDTIGDMLDQMLNMIFAIGPDILSSGVEIIVNVADGILQSYPVFLDAIGDLLDQMLNAIFAIGPEIFSSGVDLILNLVNGLINRLPDVINAAVNIMSQLLSTILSNAPQMLEQGITLIGKLIAGLISAIPKVISAVPKIISGIVDTFKNFDWLEIGSNIISGIVNGITAGISSIIDAAWDAAKSALSAAKRALGIASPSKRMRDEVGKFIPAGIAEGIKRNVNPISDAMDRLSDFTTNTLQSDLRISGSEFSAASTENSYGDSYYTINVYGERGQDVDELADVLMEKFQFILAKKEAQLR